MPDNTKTFLLGAGAQKAGTTWLYNYIASFGNVETGAYKELHVWDAMFVPGFEKFRQSPFRIASHKRYIRWRMQRSTVFYFDYFAGLLDKPGKNFTADITPGYCALGAKEFAQIKSGFQERGINTKICFLMRDPVERCWSAMRMVRKRGVSGNDVQLPADEDAALLAYYNSDAARIRSNYPNTVREIEKVFAPDEIFFGLYETLFDTSSLNALSAFLGLPVNQSFAQNHFNVSAKVDGISDATRSIVANHFHEVYEYCAQRFPETLDHWSGYKFLS